MVDVPSNTAPSTGPPPASAPPAGAAPPPPPPPKQSTAMAETNGAGSNTPIADFSNASATQVRPGGAPARVYLNDRIVPHLLEGMKSVARDQPANPLRVLGEFLIQKSNELENDVRKDSD